MGARTKIEWTRGADGSAGATWTPIRARNRATGKIGWHCERVTPGCEHCYSEGMNKRLGTGLPFKPGLRADVEIFLDEKMLLEPLRWRRPRMIFVNSMTDTFADFVPDAMIDRIFAIAALCPQHTFQFLTKRSERMRAYCSDPLTPRRVHAEAHKITGGDTLIAWPLPNCWLGVSAEDQRRADERVPDLLATPAAVRFVSAEPLLGGIDLSAIDVDGHHQVLPLGATWLDRPGDEGFDRLDWIIVGGESGAGARPMHPDWARSIRDQCAAAGVAYFHKQNGEWAPAPTGADDTFEAHRARGARDFFLFRDGTGVELVGKSRAGRLLDGVEWNGMPEVRHD